MVLASITTSTKHIISAEEHNDLERLVNGSESLITVYLGLFRDAQMMNSR
jgi:hypothetical protein